MDNGGYKKDSFIHKNWGKNQLIIHCPIPECLSLTKNLIICLAISYHFYRINTFLLTKKILSYCKSIFTNLWKIYIFKTIYRELKERLLKIVFLELEKCQKEKINIFILICIFRKLTFYIKNSGKNFRPIVHKTNISGNWSMTPNYVLFKGSMSAP